LHRTLYVALGLLAAACASAKGKVAPPAPAATACASGNQATIYLIDGQPVSCTAAMRIPADRIASVEVLKGPAALALYGPSAFAGVVSIQTKQDPAPPRNGET
jgi:TonB-dependent SusC/RagA subfamily outer membrane receptor